MTKLSYSPQNIVYSAVFLTPALLLWTPNFSVGVIAALFLYSLYYCFTNRQTISLSRFDWLVILCLSSYAIANIPNVIIDNGSLRYVDGPSRFIACISIYIMLRHMAIDTKTTLDKLELGVIIGSIGSFLIAYYQYFILEMNRVDGFLFSINFGYLSCSLLFLAFALLPNAKYKKLLCVSIILSLFATLWTETRGSIFAIPLLLGAAAVFWHKKISIKHIVLATALLVGTSTILYTYSKDFHSRMDYTAQEFSNIASGNVEDAVSTGGRLQLWKSAIEAFKVNPMGLTYSEREALIKELHAKGEVTDWVLSIGRGHAHSQYFEMLASNGVLGIAAIALILFAPSLYFLSHHNAGDCRVAFLGFLFVCGFIIFGLTEAPLQANLISAYYAFMVVLFVALQENSDSQLLNEK